MATVGLNQEALLGQKVIMHPCSSEAWMKVSWQDELVQLAWPYHQEVGQR